MLKAEDMLSLGTYSNGMGKPYDRSFYDSFTLSKEEKHVTHCQRKCVTGLSACKKSRGNVGVLKCVPVHAYAHLTSWQAFKWFSVYTETC